jgi:geranylgeranyl reductase family protein
MSQDYDIAIIGAGPGGCACALALQGSGLRVVLIDKAKFPRDKVCGDAIPGASFKAMDAINIEWGRQMREFADKADVRASTVYLPKNRKVTYRWVSYSCNSKRADFDNFLIQLVRGETQTEVLEEKWLSKISINDNGAFCEFRDGSSIRAKLIIGCDGANSVVKKHLSSGETKDKEALAAIRAYYTGIKGIEAGENEFHLIKGLDGYFWIFPLANGWANVGFGVMKKRRRNENSPKDLRGTLAKILSSPSLAARFENAVLMHPVNGFGLPIWTRKRRISGERLMLCGDAAELIDPLQGHGIDKAMWSGVFAARQAINCFQADNFSPAFMQRYETMLYNKMGTELSRSYWILKNVQRFPFLFDLILKIKPNQRLASWITYKLKI